MRAFRDFLFGEVEPWALKVVGNLIGAIGVMFCALTLWLVYINVRGFFGSEAGERVVSGSFLLGSALLSYWLIRTAHRAVTYFGKDEVGKNEAE